MVWALGNAAIRTAALPIIVYQLTEQACLLQVLVIDTIVSLYQLPEPPYSGCLAIYTGQNIIK